MYLIIEYLYVRYSRTSLRRNKLTTAVCEHVHVHAHIHNHSLLTSTQSFENPENILRIYITRLKNAAGKYQNSIKVYLNDKLNYMDIIRVNIYTDCY